MMQTVSLSARTWIIGVAKGDYFIYETYGVYTTSNPNITIDIPAFEHNNTRWVKIAISDTKGTVINQIYTLHYSNESESTFLLSTNLDPASPDNLNFSGKGIPICAANLNVGERLSTVPLIINETQTRDYRSGQRLTNQVAWNTTDDCGNCYFDRETGVLVETYRVHRFVNQKTGDMVEKADVIKLVETNRWQIKALAPVANAIPSAITIVIAALIVAFVLLKKANPLKMQTSA